jgi:hypothetical protein
MPLNKASMEFNLKVSINKIKVFGFIGSYDYKAKNSN